MPSQSTSQTKRLDLTDSELTCLEEALRRYSNQLSEGYITRRPLFENTLPETLLHKIRRALVD